jgi:hypothetical protein
MKKSNRFLANYLKSRWNKTVQGATKEELEDFLDENGWILYDLESMVKNFLEWRKKEDLKKTQVLM